MAIQRLMPKVYTVNEAWTAAVGTYDRHIQSADRFVLGVEDGMNISTWTVQPGDNLGSTGERAEIVMGGWQNSRDWVPTGYETSVEYFRIKVKIPSPWVPPDVNGFGYQWGIFFQVHGPNFVTNSSPPIALGVLDTFNLFVNGGNRQAMTGGFATLTNAALVLDAWIDFVIEVKWSTGADGYAKLYRKDAGASGFVHMGGRLNQPTLLYSGTPVKLPHYSKCGFYRSESDHNNVIKLAPLTRTTDATIAFA